MDRSQVESLNPRLRKVTETDKNDAQETCLNPRLRKVFLDKLIADTLNKVNEMMQRKAKELEAVQENEAIQVEEDQEEDLGEDHQEEDQGMDQAEDQEDDQPKPQKKQLVLIPPKPLTARFWPCKICIKKKLPTQAALHHHLKKVHLSKPKGCEKCGMSMSNKWRLVKHISKCRVNLLNWECQSCPKTFAVKRAWTRHEARCMVAPRCGQCEEVLITKKAQKNHVCPDDVDDLFMD